MGLGFKYGLQAFAYCENEVHGIGWMPREMLGVIREAALVKFGGFTASGRLRFYWQGEGFAHLQLVALISEPVIDISFGQCQLVTASMPVA